MKLKNKTVSAFTLLESLLTLGIACFIIMMLSGSLNGIFQNVEEKIFFYRLKISIVTRKN